MFVHSGASYHGHEFSNTLPRPTQRRSPLRRAAYSTPNSLSAAIQSSSSSLHSTRPLSAGEETPRIIKERVSFVEPERDTMSEDGMSYSPSESSTTAGSTRKKRRKSSRPSTTFHLAHPAPKLKHRQRLLHIRPQLLLQLQRLSTSSRPIPSLDVLPSTTLVPRLSKRFPHMFKGKNGLGANDVVCAKSEDYKTSLGDGDDSSDSDDEAWAHRDIVAVICQMRKGEGGARGKAGICFSDGSIWEATPISASVMEFVRTDELGQQTKARWVRRRDARSSYSPEIHTDDRDVKFTFSIIDPNSRRHPVIASLTRCQLDIPDYYTALSAAARSKSPMFDAIDEDGSDNDTVEEPTIHMVDERLKTLIQVTGVWVALLHGWSPNFSYNNQRPTSLTVKDHAGNGSRTRSSSMNQDPAPRSPQGETRSSTPESCRESAGAILRRTSNQFLHRNSSTSNGPSAPVDTATSAPRRSISTGTAFMQRAAARKASQHPSTIPSDNEDDLLNGRADHSTDLAGFLDSQNDNHAFSKPDESPNASPKSPSLNGRRDVQSAYYSSPKFDTEVSLKPSTGRARGSTDGSVPRQTKEKESKWKRMTSVFRRSHKNKH